MYIKIYFTNAHAFYEYKMCNLFLNAKTKRIWGYLQWMMKKKKYE